MAAAAHAARRQHSPFVRAALITVSVLFLAAILIMPVVSVLGYASVPITSEDVDITKAGDDEPIIDHPITSFGAGLTLGLGVPIADSGWKLGAAFTRLELYRIRGDHEGVSQLTFSVETKL